MNSSRLRARDRDGEQPDARTDPRLFSDDERSKVAEVLSLKLGPEFVSSRVGPGGSKLSYLEGWKVIQLANDILGFNGWSTSVVDITVDFLDCENGKYSLGISAIVRVTLKDGTFHEDVGYGSIENCRSKITAFEKAKKEAITDALKRALRSFGNCLGNCLYDKEYMKKVTKLQAPKHRPLNPDDLYRHKDFTVEQNRPAPTAAQQPTAATSGPAASDAISVAPKDAASAKPFSALNTLQPSTSGAAGPLTASSVNTNDLIDMIDDDIDDEMSMMFADVEYMDPKLFTDPPVSNIPNVPHPMAQTMRNQQPFQQQPQQPFQQPSVPQQHSMPNAPFMTGNRLMPAQPFPSFPQPPLPPPQQQQQQQQPFNPQAQPQPARQKIPSLPQNAINAQPPQQPHLANSHPPQIQNQNMPQAQQHASRMQTVQQQPQIQQQQGQYPTSFVPASQYGPGQRNTSVNSNGNGGLAGRAPQASVSASTGMSNGWAGSTHVQSDQRQNGANGPGSAPTTSPNMNGTVQHAGYGSGSQSEADGASGNAGGTPSSFGQGAQANASRFHSASTASGSAATSSSGSSANNFKRPPPLLGGANGSSKPLGMRISPSQAAGPPPALPTSAAGGGKRTRTSGDLALTYPLVTVSTRQQVSKTKATSQTQAILHILKEEGVQGLYSGISSAMFGIAVTQYVYYYWYEFVKAAYEQAAQGRALTITENMVTGAIAGAATATLTNPIWVINTRLVVKKESLDEDATKSVVKARQPTMFEAAMKIYKEEGLAGFFRGLRPALVLVINPVIQFTVFERLRMWWEKRRGGALNGLDFFVLGALSKLCATSVTYPYIVIKSRMQLKEGGDASTRYSSLLDGVRKIIRTEGVRGLYNGIESKLLQSVLSSAFTFAFKEELFSGAVWLLALLRLRADPKAVAVQTQQPARN